MHTKKEKVSSQKEKKSGLLSAAGKRVFYTQKVNHMLMTKGRNCIFIICMMDLFIGSTFCVTEPCVLRNSQITLMGGEATGDGCLPPESVSDKDTSLSCHVTNCMFKVTNHLIKIYKQLNTV